MGRLPVSPSSLVSLHKSVDSQECERFIQEWRDTPWHGGRYVLDEHLWMPKRSYYEILRNLTGAYLPDDPDCWENWVRAHPRLVWDANRGRLIDAP